MHRIFLFTLLYTALCANIQAQSWYGNIDIAFGSRYDDIVFVTQEIAFACSGEGRIVKSTDGGVHWETSLLDQGEYFRAIDFIDEDRGFASSLRNKLFATTNGGDTWEEITDRLPAGTPGFCGLSHIGDTVFAAGIFSSPAVFARSYDAGNSWEVRNLDSLADGFAEIEFVSATRGFVAGTKGQDGATLLLTEDGGNSWQEVLTTETSLEYVWKLFFLSDQDVYASIESFSDETSIAISSDGGNTWEEKFVSPQGLDIQGIAFTSRDTGWVSPRGLSGFETFDGGETWNMNAFIPGNLNRAVFRPDSTLFASGSTIYYYSEEELVSGIGSKSFTPSTTMSVVNPASTSTGLDLTITLKKSSNVRLDILTSSGQFVESIFSGRMDQGSRPISHQLLKRITTGTYIVAMRSDDNFHAEKIIVTN